MALPLLLVLLFSGSAWAQNVGDRIILVERALGIPGHPAPNTTSVSHRFPGGITVSVTAIGGTGSNWFAISDDSGNAAWIIRSYIASVVPTGPATATGQCYEVGLWNLEHFGKGKVRGFPENTSGGPSYPPRTATDLSAIVNAIRDVIRARILVLTEINGSHDEENDAAPAVSEELDDLVSRLGPSFRYVIAKSGSSQRIAILWDTRFARLNTWQEMDVANPKVQGKGIFDRHPVMGHFTFLLNGQSFNDLLVVGLHLASGQQLTANHDQAMGTVVTKLGEARQAGTVLPAAEFDILMVGDLNASWFDTNVEQFFDQLNNGDWRVLARDNTYPATRLAGVPLQPRSQIDYLIASRNLPGKRGLFGEEITAEQATVHHDLAEADWDGFRRVFSDHFPVTTCVAVIPDND